MRHLHPHFRLAPLSLAIALTLAAPCIVQAQPTDSGKAVAISIAPQSLGSALNELSDRAGVSIAFSPALVAGKTAPAVKGSLTLHQALGQLLAGSGLAASEDGTSIVIKNARSALSASDQESTLPVVKVTAQSVKDGTTEGTGSYIARASSTATKLNLSPRETPQTLTVVTRQKMDDFGLNNIDNVLESSSTIAIHRRGADGAAYYSRGFALQSQFDGIPNPLGLGEYNRGPAPDTAFLDKVEILQGANGLMSGAGEPGGTINLVRKRPTEQFQAHIETQIGSWSKKRLIGDVSGSLVDSGKIRGRLVALIDKSDAFTDYVYDDKQGLYGIVEADLTATTTVGASVMYQKNDFNMHYGVPMAPNGADLGLSRSSFYGLSNGDSKKETANYTLDIAQKLPSEWLLKAAYTRTDTTNEGVLNNLAGTLNPTTGSGLILVNTLQDRKINSDVFDIYASGPFQLLGRKHELVVGASAARMKDKSRLAFPIAFSAIPNIYSFNGTQIPRPSSQLSDWPVADETNQQGVYGAARLNLTDSFKAIFGARLSSYEYKSEGIQAQKENSIVSPYAGLIFDINSSTSLYASYSDIFKPQSNLKLGGGTIDPIVGKNYELGVKGEFLQGHLNASAAIFRLEQTNLAQVDTSTSSTACNGRNCYIAAGLVVSQGVDLGLNGELLPGWQIGASYTFVESEYGNGADKGKAYGTYMPQHILRAHTTYLIPGTNWTVGGNIRTQSRMYTEDTGFRIEQGGYTVVGLMAKYRISKHSELSLMVNNLLDQRYYESIGSYGTNLENFYGAPRNFAVNLKYAF